MTEPTALPSPTAAAPAAGPTDPAPAAQPTSCLQETTGAPPGASCSVSSKGKKPGVAVAGILAGVFAALAVQVALPGGMSGGRWMRLGLGFVAAGVGYLAGTKLLGKG